MRAAWSARLLRFPALLSILVACGPGGVIHSNTTAKIDAFGADPAIVAKGESTTLRWITRDATSVWILNEQGESLDLSGAKPDQGSVEVTATTSTTYTLHAKGNGGEVSRDVRVEVIDGSGLVAKIWLEPEVMSFGGKSTLRWHATGASLVTISRDGRVFITTTDEFEGEREIESMDAVVFEIVASGTAGKATATANLSVKPFIESFTTSLNRQVYPGDLVEVRWDIKGADQVILSNLDGFEEPVPREGLQQGSRKIPAGKEGAFRLIASRAGVEETKDLQVELVGPPTVTRFVADPPAISEGKPPKEIKVSWVVQNGGNLHLESSVHGKIDISDKKVPAGSVQVADVSPGTIFTLWATNSMASTKEVLTVEEVPFGNILGFRAVPARVSAGEPFTLVWTTEGVAGIELRQVNGPKLSVDASDVNGSHEMSLDKPENFEIQAANLAGDKVTAVVNVFFAAPEVRFQTGRPQVIPGGELRFTWENKGGSSMEIRQVGGPTVFESHDPWLIEKGEGTLVAPSTEGYFTYEMVAANAKGETGRSSVEVLISRGPEILSFTASPGPVKAGQAVDFAWEVKDGPQGGKPILQLVDDLDNVYDISGIDPNLGSASIVVDDPGKRVFTLEASVGTAFPSMATASSDIFGPPELQFTADPPSYDPFNKIPVTLQWQTLYGSKIWLHRISESGAILETLIDGNENPTTVGRSFRNVVPQVPGQWYRARVENPWGESDQADLYADYLLPTIHSFTTSPASIPKNGNVTVSWNTGGGKTFINGPLQPHDMVEEGKSFVSIQGLTGTNTVTFLGCPSTTPNDEGCTAFNFPTGFLFPFDGKLRTAAKPFTNGWVNLDFSVAAPGDTWPTIGGTTLPSTTKRYMQLVPYVQDMWITPTFLWRDATDEEGRHIVIQFTPVSGGAGHYQVVLRESGVFEYRYGTMSGANSNVVGYQNDKGTVGRMLPNGTNLATISGKTWRYEPQVLAVSSFTMPLEATTTFRLCVYGPEWDGPCEEKTVIVTP